MPMDTRPPTRSPLPSSAKPSVSGGAAGSRSDPNAWAEGCLEPVAARQLLLAKVGVTRWRGGGKFTWRETADRGTKAGFTCFVAQYLEQGMDGGRPMLPTTAGALNRGGWRNQVCAARVSAAKVRLEALQRLAPTHC